MNFKKRIPNIENSELIAIDIETHDPNLKKMGTGVYRKDGYILGVAFSALFGNKVESCYCPYDKNHEEYIKFVLNLNIDKVGANLLYDFDWLINSSLFIVNGKWNDVQIAEPLIYEYSKSYSLDSLGDKYLNIRKKKDEIQNFADLNNWKGDPRQHLAKMPIDLVAKYAMMDTELTLKVFLKQKKELVNQNLKGIYDLEIRLLPLLCQMKKNGVKVDTQKRDDIRNILANKIETIEKSLCTQLGKNFNYNSPKDIEKLFDSLGLEFNRRDPTIKMQQKGIEVGNPILDQKALKKHDNNFTIKNILEVKKYKNCLSTFFINSFTDMEIEGYIHGSFNPLRSDKYGTVSGRLSASLPNLQNVPYRDPYLGNLCRSIFIPIENHLWGKIDWSQIEYRIIAHYAIGKGSEEIRDRYKNDPNVDYHSEIQALAGWPATDEYRKLAKNLNFGAGYGMGVKTASEYFGWSFEYAEHFLNEYRNKVPFVSRTLNEVSKIAKKKGFIKTILNRRARLKDRNKGYVMFNRLIQGSAADIMKKSMVDAYENCIFTVLKPHVTVHDELDVSIPKNKHGTEAFYELKNIMENCVKLRVPIKADAEIGPNWSNLKKIETKKQFKEEIENEARNKIISK